MTPRDLAQFRACLLELGPTARALALPKGYLLNGNQANQNAQAEILKDGQGDAGTKSPETVPNAEDRSPKEA